LLLQKFPNRPPFRVVEVESAPASDTVAALETATKISGAREPPIGSSAETAKS
jgi:hypothetical protein